MFRTTCLGAKDKVGALRQGQEQEQERTGRPS